MPTRRWVASAHRQREKKKGLEGVGREEEKRQRSRGKAEELACKIQPSDMTGMGLNVCGILYHLQRWNEDIPCFIRGKRQEYIFLFLLQTNLC